MSNVAKIARDEAIASVSKEPWISRAVAHASKLPKGWEGTGEQVRVFLSLMGLEPPHHHNAWGAVIKRCVELGILKKTGKMDHMQTKKSHARMTPVYVR